MQDATQVQQEVQRDEILEEEEPSWEVYSSEGSDFSYESEESSDEECGDEIQGHKRRKRDAFS